MSTKKHDGEAFARLRAADPAADLTPDHEVLRQAVTVRAGVVDELAVRRRRPHRALQVAAASAGALAIGAGGFALGGGFAASGVASTASGGESVSAESGALDAAVETPAPGSLPGVSRPNVGGMGDGAAGFSPQGGGTEMATDAMVRGYGGRILFTASGLPTSGSSAEAYGFDTTAAYSKESVRALADALGVEGEVTEEYGTFTIGSYDSAYVSVYRDGTVSFSYYDSAKDPWKCEEESGECEERDLGDAPQGDEAIDATRELLVTLGMDPASFELEASDAEWYGSEDYSSVTAFVLLDGQRTGQQWGVSFTGAGIQSVWGILASTTSLGEYDVVSPAEAVERLNDPRFGPSNQFYPLDWAGPADAGVSMRSPDEGSLPGTPAPGSSFSWTVEGVTITSHTLELSPHHFDDGSVALVPTYTLGSADGRSWSVIAVADSHLDF